MPETFYGIHEGNLYKANYGETALWVEKKVKAYTGSRFSKEANKAAKDWGVDSPSKLLKKRQLQLCSPLDGLVNLEVAKRLEQIKNQSK